MTIDHDSEPPPFLRTWKRVYTAVLLYCAVLIAVLYLITRSFRS
ncbi:MAG TPA: hypothetical protein VKX25_17275 [Bryobacteraceae bacterium]|jgi:hypothetical protein|nr:hypothetical protein [Bryobacteraceae bacterium]